MVWSNDVVGSLEVRYSLLDPTSQKQQLWGSDHRQDSAEFGYATEYGRSSTFEGCGHFKIGSTVSSRAPDSPPVV
jgi:hypothetical protein